MAKFQCICGERLWNGLVPNDIQIHATEIELWNKAMSENVAVLDWPEEDVWRCPQCFRLYLFKGIKVTEVYELEEVSKAANRIETCKCGNKDIFQEYVVYTDKEIDGLTSDVDYINEMPQPRRVVHRCKDCLRVYSFNYDSMEMKSYVYVPNAFDESEEK
ncbi:hypothetical protein [Paenibacillus kobensis]|uniref:hypothetical protein n=1 Tax=Paenibacillus kobensis TaxID=59841 RepID=UPI000FD94EB0|nr:hypothetical protein [Paenibacillus kobensis]